MFWMMMNAVYLIFRDQVSGFLDHIDVIVLFIVSAYYMIKSFSMPLSFITGWR